MKTKIIEFEGTPISAEVFVDDEGIWRSSKDTSTVDDSLWKAVLKRSENCRIDIVVSAMKDAIAPYIAIKYRDHIMKYIKQQMLKELAN